MNGYSSQLHIIFGSDGTNSKIVSFLQRENSSQPFMNAEHKSVCNLLAAQSSIVVMIRMLVQIPLLPET